MTISRCICLTVLLWLSVTASGAVIRGRVAAAHGNALPYAAIYLEGTTVGTNANGDGAYELTVMPGLYQVRCQFLGYKLASFAVSITGDESITHNFVLESESLEMKEVVVHANGEDPAYGIMWQAIGQRAFHLQQIQKFQANIYLKGVMRTATAPGKVLGQKVNPGEMGLDSSGKGVLYLLEEDADYYMDGDKERTVIHSVRESGNPGSVGFSTFPAVITFYENLVNLMGRTSRGYISPLNDHALNYYRYKLLGTISEQGHNIYKIAVTPKRAFEPCFMGVVYIADSSFAIQQLNLSLTTASGLNMLDTLRVDQLYLPQNPATWIIKSQVIHFALKVFGFDIGGDMVTVYNRQQINGTMPDSLFSDRITSQYDQVANKKDTAYWTTKRPIPLEADEQKDYLVKDSLRLVLEDPRRIDSLRRRGNRLRIVRALATGYTYKSKELKNEFHINPIFVGLPAINWVNFNAVEGFNIAPKVNWKHNMDSERYVVTEAALRYGFANSHFNAISRVTYVANDKHWKGRAWLLGGEAGQYVFQFNPDNPVPPWFDSYAALLYHENELRLHERKEIAAFARRYYGNGLTWLVRASYQDRHVLNNATEYSLFRQRGDEFRQNVPQHLVDEAGGWEDHKAMIIYGSVSYKPGTTYTQYPDYKIANGSSWPRLTLDYEKGISGLYGSKTNFDRLRFSIHDDVSLKLAGKLNYNFAIGGFLNTNYVSIPDLMHVFGNRGLGYAAPYLQSFQLAQIYEFSNKSAFYGEAHIEYHLNGLLTNKIPLLKQAKWNLLFGGNVFESKYHEYYAEAFVGLDNIGWKVFRILRIDFVQSWDSHGGHNSGIRFGLSGRSPAGSGNNPTHNEW